MRGKRRAKRGIHEHETMVHAAKDDQRVSTRHHPFPFILLLQFPFFFFLLSQNYSKACYFPIHYSYLPFQYIYFCSSPFSFHFHSFIHNPIQFKKTKKKPMKDHRGKLLRSENNYIDNGENYFGDNYFPEFPCRKHPASSSSSSGGFAGSIAATHI